MNQDRDTAAGTVAQKGDLSPARVAFGRFELDLVAGQLFADGRPLRTRHKNLAVLTELVRRAGQPVTRDELLASVWSGVQVQDETLTASIAELRRLFGDSRKDPKFIETIHGKGFRFVAPVEVRDRVDTVDSPALLTRRSSLVGREAEVRWLHEAHAEARAGRGSLALLRGEEGIGKTSVIEGFVASLAADVAVCTGRCIDHDAAPYLWPWAQILRDVTRSVDPASSENAGEEIDSIVADPDVWTLTEEPANATSPESRFRLFARLAARLLGASARRALVLVLEDLHYADTDSLRLLEFLVHEIRDSPLLVVATARTSATAASPELEQTLLRLQGIPHVRETTIPPLSRDAVSRLVRSVAGDDVDERIVMEIARDTGGNPFFVTQVVRHLVEHSPIPSLASGASIRDLGVPDSIQRIVDRRLEELDDDCREILAAASVIGREFDVATLARVRSREASQALPDVLDDVLPSLDAAIRGGILEDAAEVRSFRFTHALFRDAIYRRQDLAARARRHRWTAEALEAEPRSHPLTRVAELAEHFFVGGVAEKAVLYCERAGDAALRAFAYESAVRLYGRALEALRLAAEPCRATEVRLCAALAEAHWKLGNLAECTASGQRATDLARELGDAELLARAALSYGQQTAAPRNVATWEPFDSSVLRNLEEALTRLPPGPGELRARVLSRLAWALYYAHEPGERWLELSEQAVEMARAAGSHRSLLSVLHERHIAMMTPRLHAARVRVADEMESVARLHEERDSLAVVRELQGWNHLEAGDASATDVAMAEFAALAVELGEPAWRWVDLLWRGTRATMTGRFAEAEATLEQMRELGRRMKPDVTEFAYQTQVVALRLAETRLSEVEPTLRMLSFLPAPRALLAYHFAEQGQLEEAREECASLLGEVVEREPADTVWLMVATLLADTSATLGDRDACAQLYSTLLPFARLHVVLGTHAAVYGGAVARVLGRLAAVAERWDVAEAHFTAARDAHDRAGARPWLAETHYEWALLCRGRKGPNDARKAGQRLRVARDLAAKLGMPGLLRKLEAAG